MKFENNYNTLLSGLSAVLLTFAVSGCASVQKKEPQLAIPPITTFALNDACQKVFDNSDRYERKKGSTIFYDDIPSGEVSWASCTVNDFGTFVSVAFAYDVNSFITKEIEDIGLDRFADITRRLELNDERDVVTGSNRTIGRMSSIEQDYNQGLFDELCYSYLGN
jgi:hypothetical protein